MKKKDDHRTIRLDADVANIASELASKRKLSEVLSELLRREYGTSFEEDLIQSKMNELNRQREGIERAMNDLQEIVIEKKRKIDRQNKIKELEEEFSLLKFNMDEEIKKAREQSLDHYDIITDGLEAWEITAALAKARGEERLSITKKFNERREQIIIELAELKEA